MPQREGYERARARAESKYGFYVHVVVYVVIMTLLTVIDLLTSPGEVWFVWPMAGWGIAVILHGLGVFIFSDKNAIVDAMTERELTRLNRHEGDGPV